MFDFSSYISLAADLAKQYGPDAWAMVLKLYRIDAVGYIGISLGLGTISVILLNRERKMFLICKTKVEKDDCSTYSDHKEFGWFIFYGIVGSVLAINPLLVLFNIWTWVELFYPDYYVAAKIITKVMH